MLPNHCATRKGKLAESLSGFFSAQFWQTPDRRFQHFEDEKDIDPPTYITHIDKDKRQYSQNNLIKHFKFLQ